VNIGISVGSNGVALALSPNSVTLQLPVGSKQQRTINFVDANKNTQLNVNANIQSNVNWLTASNNTGTSFTLNIDATVVGAGTQNGTITVQNNGQGSPFVAVTVTVTAFVTPGASPNAIPSVLNFSAAQGRANPAPQTVAITTSDGSTQGFTVSAIPAFTTITPTSGTASLSNTNITVTVNTNALQLGSNFGTITVTLANGGSTNLSVTATLAQFSISANPNTTQTVSLATGKSQVIPIQVGTSDGAAAQVAVTTQVNNGSGWLSASPTSINAPQQVSVTVSSGSMAAGNYTGSVTFSCSGSSSCNPVNVPINLNVTASPNQPTIFPGGVILASNFGAFATISPGSFVEIYGSNLGSTQAGWAGGDFKNNVAPTSLFGVSAQVDGKQAFVNFVSSGQVNIVVPDGIATGGNVQLVLSTSNGNAPPVSVKTAALTPGMLAPPLFNINGKQYVVAFNPDGSYVLPAGVIGGLNSHPAKPNDVIVIYGIGFGPVDPPIPSGTIETVQNTLHNSFQVFFGGTAAPVPPYYGLAPGYVSLYQLNIRVPAVPDNDAVAFTFTLGGTPGVQTLYTAVHQ
jgi:uncharacterized protein (TIGR03437 family)